MDNEQIARIKEYIQIINPSVEDDDLLEFCINEVGDRVQLYLNSDKVPTKVERIIAKVINTGLMKCQADIESYEAGESTVDRAITSISDNGQSISYANEVTKYFTTASDEELFTGFSDLLSRYRRVKVVYPKINEESNS